jgi:signal peptidase II
MYGIYALACVGLLAFIVPKWGRLSFFMRLAWTLVVVGALSNIADRLMFGYVRDFIQVGSGYLNFADFYILIGVGLLLFYERRSLRSNT